MPRKPKEQRTEDGRVIQFTTIKARLYPNGAQAELFEKTFGCCRYIWNRMLADQQRFYRETGAHFIPTPAKYKREAPFLREVDNQALIQEHNKLSQAFRVFFRNPDSKASAGKIGVDADGLSINGKKFSVSNDNGVLTFTGIDTTELKSANLDTSVVVTASTAGVVSNPNAEASGGNQGWDQGWKVLEEAVNNSTTAIGHAAFDLADLKIKDGTTVKIGDQTYTFALGSKSQFKGSANVVDLTDMETLPEAGSDDWVKVVGRLTAAAAGNKMVSVTSASTKVSTLGSGEGDGTNILDNTDPSVVLLTEKFGGLDRDKYDVFGKIYDKTAGATNNDTALTHDAKWKTADGISLVQVGDAKINGKSLTLQIGDTSDSFNQLKVSINDCHVAAMGLGSMDISTQAGAAAAVNQIKNAINYVSDVRGTLGATQNRLDHTINNLSVMRENIQDAESTIRDTDIAEEMMSYTKNNILVQSAQAMLAQANQIPQGVLQLLG